MEGVIASKLHAYCRNPQRFSEGRSNENHLQAHAGNVQENEVEALTEHINMLKQTTSKQFLHDKCQHALEALSPDGATDMGLEPQKRRVPQEVLTKKVNEIYDKVIEKLAKEKKEKKEAEETKRPNARRKKRQC